MHNFLPFSSFLVLAYIHTTGMLGPMFGFMLGSFLAKTYVDIGFVDLGMGHFFQRKKEKHFV